MSSSKVRPLNVILSIILATASVFLGLWQLNRASDLKDAKRVVKDVPAVAIEKLAKPNSNLAGGSVNRLALLKGSYVQEFQAPNQKVTIGDLVKRETLEVRLMKLNSSSGILVVRGVEPIAKQNLAGEIKVMGRLYPRQSNDVAELAQGSLTRIDPALVVGDTDLNLIDGYVIAITEATAMGEPIAAERIAAVRAIPKVAGYYWQHITYVGIWWLFALLLLFAPFYDRLREGRMRVR